MPGQEKTPAQGAGGPILTQPSPTPPKLLWLLMQPGPKPGGVRKSNAAARTTPHPGRSPHLGAGSAGARCPVPAGGSPALGAAGLTDAAAGAAASAGAAAGRPAACSLTAAGRQKGRNQSVLFPSLAAETSPGRQRPSEGCPRQGPACLRPGAGLLRLVSLWLSWMEALIYRRGGEGKK